MKRGISTTPLSTMMVIAILIAMMFTPSHQERVPIWKRRDSADRGRKISAVLETEIRVEAGSWVRCRAPDQDDPAAASISIQSLNVIPQVVKRGGQIYAEIRARFERGTLNSGKVEVLVYRGSVVAFRFDYDLCKTGEVFRPEDNIRCPIEPSANILPARITQSVPRFAPPGRYVAQATVRINDKYVSCVQFAFDVSR